MYNFDIQSDGKSALHMTCPKCGIKGPHPIIRTDPKQYHWDQSTVELFERIAGRDLSFRMRTKKCMNCEKQFQSAELGFVFLAGLVKEVKDLERMKSEFQEALNMERKDNAAHCAEIKALHTAIRNASKLLTGQLPKRKK